MLDNLDSGEAGPSFSAEEDSELFDDPDAEGSPSETDSEDESSSASENEEEAGAGDVTRYQTKRSDGQGGGDDTAELQIESDFDRLISSIRQSDGGTSGGSGGATMLSRMWDFNLEEREAEFMDDLRAASGVGKAGKGKGKRGRRPGPTLSPQVRALIGEGNQAYVDADLPGALRAMQEAIRIEPRASSAWAVLAQCYADLGEPSRALRLRVVAAHLAHDAEEWDRLARQSKDMGYTQQALYCFGKVYSLDPTNLNAMWDRASLAKEVGNLRVARHALLALLKRVPHDLTVLDELRPILIETSDLALCASLFEGAFAHHQALHPSGPPAESASDASALAVPAPGSNESFGLLSILVLADLYTALGRAAHAVRAVRAGCRWLQGRGSQRFWDACEDDREWDLEGVVTSPREGEPKPGMYPLDVNARHRLAVARIKMGDVEEGKMHASIVLAHDVMDYAPLFAEIADALFEREMYAEARPIYEVLGADAGTSSLYVLMQTAACRRMLGDLREATEVYEHIVSADTSNNDAKMKLAEIYEILNEPRKALDLVYQVIDSRKRKGGTRGADGDATGDAAGSLFEEIGGSQVQTQTKSTAAKRKKLSTAELRALEEQKEQEVQNGFFRTRELWPRVRLDVTDSDGDVDGEAGREEAEREWLFEAERLVETFRETRRLFLADRNPFRGMAPARRRKKMDETSEDNMASRLHLDLAYDSMHRKSKGGPKTVIKVDVFREVSFEDWLTLIMQYTFLLTKRDQYDLAEEVLTHVLVSNAYQHREAQDTIRLALITIGIAARRHPSVVHHCRKLMNAYQFNNEPVRILLAALSSGLRSTDAFIPSTLQKHMLRELKLADTAVHNKGALKWHAVSRRWALAAGGASKDDAPDADEDDEDDEAEAAKDAGGRDGVRALPGTDNPMLVAVYGQMCNAAKSYQSAIFYLLHAFDHCAVDPTICLSLAIAFIGRAMQRQADNRHYFITQAMAFLSRYRAIRGAEAEDEVEFNFGRAFHQLGLYSLAVRHYERVLALADEKAETEWGVAREAAYNLSLIYVITGAAPLAKDLYRRWLSI